ncbi:hypothetical protein ACT7DH_12260 [Bacillus pacificus]
MNQVGGDKEQFNRLYGAFQNAKAEVYGKRTQCIWGIMLHGLENENYTTNSGTKRVMNGHAV